MVCNVLHKWISHYLYDDDVNEMLPASPRSSTAIADSARRRQARRAAASAAMAKKQQVPRRRREGRARAVDGREHARVQDAFDRPPPPRCSSTGGGLAV